ncbi:MAG TPA: hypothetical protein VKZ92_05205 [Pseudohongiella sp.]|nr:hypothetical protein [Pseudohongiella sp.]
METIPRKLRIAAQGLGAAALLTTGAAALAQSSATIPAGMQGTYELTFTGASGNGPVLLPNGTKLDLVLASGGVACIADYVLLSPGTSGSPAEAVYSVPSLGITLALSNVATGQFNEVNVFTNDSNKTFLGQFNGTKKSSSTTCPELPGSSQSDLADFIKILELAEQQFADLFPGAAVKDNALRIIDGFVARSYTGSGVNVAIKDGLIYVQGGAFGNAPVTIGTIANTIAQLTGSTDPVIDDPVIDVPEGDYDLTISGNVTGSVMGFPFSQPLTLTIEKIPAPDANDIDKVEDDIRESLKDVEGLDALALTNITISEVSTSSNRVSFRVQFSANMLVQGFTVLVGYDLVYEYLKR